MKFSIAFYTMQYPIAYACNDIINNNIAIINRRIYNVNRRIKTTTNACNKINPKLCSVLTLITLSSFRSTKIEIIPDKCHIIFPITDNDCTGTF